MESTNRKDYTDEPSNEMSCPEGYHYVKALDRENYDRKGKRIHYTDTTYGTYFKKDRKELK